MELIREEKYFKNGREYTIRLVKNNNEYLASGYYNNIQISSTHCVSEMIRVAIHKKYELNAIEDIFNSVKEDIANSTHAIKPQK